MDELALELLAEHPEWTIALAAYQARLLELRQISPDAEAWIPRLTQIAPLPVESLSSVHGKLIAFGFLKYEISEKGGGVSYQLTPLGRQALAKSAGATEPDEVTEMADSEPLESIPMTASAPLAQSA